MAVDPKFANYLMTRGAPPTPSPALRPMPPVAAPRSPGFGMESLGRPPIAPDVRTFMNNTIQRDWQKRVIADYQPAIDLGPAGQPVAPGAVQAALRGPAGSPERLRGFIDYAQKKANYGPVAQPQVQPPPDNSVIAAITQRLIVQGMAPDKAALTAANAAGVTLDYDPAAAYGVLLNQGMDPDAAYGMLNEDITRKREMQPLNEGLQASAEKAAETPGSLWNIPLAPLTILDAPRQLNTALIGEAGYNRWVTQDQSALGQIFDWVDVNLGASTTGIGRQSYKDWMNDPNNRDKILIAHDRGYNGFTGGAAVWELYQADTTGSGIGGALMRGIGDITSDPLNWAATLKVVSGPVKVVGRSMQMWGDDMLRFTARSSADRMVATSYKKLGELLEGAADIATVPQDVLDQLPDFFRLIGLGRTRVADFLADKPFIGKIIEGFRRIGSLSPQAEARAFLDKMVAAANWGLEQSRIGSDYYGNPDYLGVGTFDPASYYGTTPFGVNSPPPHTGPVGPQVLPGGQTTFATPPATFTPGGPGSTPGAIIPPQPANYTSPSGPGTTFLGAYTAPLPTGPVTPPSPAMATPSIPGMTPPIYDQTNVTAEVQTLADQLGITTTEVKEATASITVQDITDAIPGLSQEEAVVLKDRFARLVNPPNTPNLPTGAKPPFFAQGLNPRKPASTFMGTRTGLPPDRSAIEVGRAIPLTEEEFLVDRARRWYGVDEIPKYGDVIPREPVNSFLPESPFLATRQPRAATPVGALPQPEPVVPPVAEMPSVAPPPKGPEILRSPGSPEGPLETPQRRANTGDSPLSAAIKTEAWEKTDDVTTVLAGDASGMRIVNESKLPDGTYRKGNRNYRVYDDQGNALRNKSVKLGEDDTYFKYEEAKKLVVATARGVPSAAQTAAAAVPTVSVADITEGPFKYRVDVSTNTVRVGPENAALELRIDSLSQENIDQLIRLTDDANKEIARSGQLSDTTRDAFRRMGYKGPSFGYKPASLESLRQAAPAPGAGVPAIRTRASVSQENMQWRRSFGSGMTSEQEYMGTLPGELNQVKNISLSINVPRNSKSFDNGRVSARIPVDDAATNYPLYSEWADQPIWSAHYSGVKNVTLADAIAAEKGSGAPKTVKTALGDQAVLADTGKDARPVFGKPVENLLEMPPQSTQTVSENDLLGGAQVADDPAARREAERLAGQTDLFGNSPFALVEDAAPEPTLASLPSAITPQKIRRDAEALVEKLLAGDRDILVNKSLDSDNIRIYNNLLDFHREEYGATSPEWKQLRDTVETMYQQSKVEKPRIVRPEQVPVETAPQGPEQIAPGVTAGPRQEIPVDRITTNPALFQVEDTGFQEEKVQNILRSFNRASLDPISVLNNGDGTYTVVHGHHRFESVKRLGEATIPAREVTGELVDLIAYAQGVNAQGRILSLYAHGNAIKKKMDAFLQSGRAETEGQAFNMAAATHTALTVEQARQAYLVTKLPGEILNNVPPNTPRYKKWLQEGHVIELAEALDEGVWNATEIGELFSKHMSQGDGMTVSRLQEARTIARNVKEAKALGLGGTGTQNMLFEMDISVIAKQVEAATVTDDLNKLIKQSTALRKKLQRANSIPSKADQNAIAALDSVIAEKNGDLKRLKDQLGISTGEPLGFYNPFFKPWAAILHDIANQAEADVIRALPPAPTLPFLDQGLIRQDPFLMGVNAAQTNATAPIALANPAVLQNAVTSSPWRKMDEDSAGYRMLEEFLLPDVPGLAPAPGGRALNAIEALQVRRQEAYVELRQWKALEAKDGLYQQGAGPALTKAENADLMALRKKWGTDGVGIEDILDPKFDVDDFRQLDAAAVEHFALDVEHQLMVNDPRMKDTRGKWTRRYDAALMAWREFKLLSPFNIIRYMLANSIGDSSQMILNGRVDAAWRWVPDSRKFIETGVFGQPGAYFDTRPGRTVQQLGLGDFNRELGRGHSQAVTGQLGVHRIQSPWTKFGNKFAPAKPLAKAMDFGRNMNNALEFARRAALWDVVINEQLVGRDIPEFTEQLAQLIERNGGDPNKVRGLITDLSTAATTTLAGTEYSGRKLFDAVTLMKSVERLSRDAGLSGSRAVGLAEQARRMWQGRIDDADAAARKFVADTLFDYQYKNVDLWATRIMPFHFWATRAIPFYLEQAIRHPGLANGYFRGMEAMEKWSEANGAPEGLTKFFRMMRSPAGYQVWINPATAIVPTFLLDTYLGRDTGQSKTKLEQWIDKGSYAGIGLYPWWKAVMANAGLISSQFNSDFTGTYTERMMTMNAVGEMAKLFGWRDESFLTDPIGDLQGWAAQKVSGTVGNEQPYIMSIQGPKTQINAEIGRRVRERMGYTDLDMATLPPEELESYAKEVARISESPDDPIYKAAYDAVLNAGSMIGLLRATMPGSKRIINTEVTRLSEVYDDQGRQGANIGNGMKMPAADPAMIARQGGVSGADAQRWMQEYRRITGKEYEEGSLANTKDWRYLQTALIRATPEWQRYLAEDFTYTTLGTKAERDIMKAYYAVVFKDPENPNWDAGDQWALKTNHTNTITKMRSLQDSFVATHPQYGHYISWKSDYRKQYNGDQGAAMYREQTSRVNPNARAYYVKQLQNIKARLGPNASPSEINAAMAEITWSLDAYAAVNGIKTRPGDTVRQTSNGGILQAPLDEGGGGAASGGDSMSEAIATLTNNVVAYLDDERKADKFLQQYSGSPSASFSALPPPVRETFLVQYGSMFPALVAESAYDVRQYLDWQKQAIGYGTNASVANYINLLYSGQIQENRRNSQSIGDVSLIFNSGQGYTPSSFSGYAIPGMQEVGGPPRGIPDLVPGMRQGASNLQELWWNR